MFARACLRACVRACVRFLIGRFLNNIQTVISEYRIVFLPEMPIPSRISPDLEELLPGLRQLALLLLQVILQSLHLLLHLLPVVTDGHVQLAQLTANQRRGTG